MSAPDARNCFETLVARMEGAVAIDACLLGLGSEGALLAERLAERLPGSHQCAALDLKALAQGVLQTAPGMTLGEGGPIVLVGAVLWHGETVVQAVSLLHQRGVKAPIELAVLADRGGRLVPVAPTYCGGDIIVAEDTGLRLLADSEILRFEENRAAV